MTPIVCSMTATDPDGKWRIEQQTPCLFYIFNQSKERIGQCTIEVEGKKAWIISKIPNREAALWASFILTQYPPALNHFIGSTLKS